MWVECDSLAEGDQRRLCEEDKSCECEDGWGGINCNGMGCLVDVRSVLVLKWYFQFVRKTKQFPLSPQYP